MIKSHVGLRRILDLLIEIMTETDQSKSVSFKDLTGKRDVSVSGVGTYFIGLSNHGNVAIETNNDDLCMVLLALTVHENGGSTLSSANADIKCFVNGSDEPLSGEIHLIDGTKLEVADKKLMFIDGPVPKRRRKLPPTPGLTVGQPPAKPTRNNKSEPTKDSRVSGSAETPPTSGETDSNNESSVDKRWLETSWCLLDLAEEDQNIFQKFNTPEQISILAASYFSKQFRMFTDASVTPQLLDGIFKLCTETIEDCKDVYMNYLSDISQALAKVPDRSNTRPMHGPAVKFLTELLKQCLDPVERVILILELLRTFSHFDVNLGTMVRHQTTAAVLGSMSVYPDVIEVQQYANDILAKIATYKPRLEKKAPLREVGIDMVIRSVKYHTTNLTLARSTCRVLASLASTLITVLNTWLDTELASDNVISTVEQYEHLLEYVFKEGIPVIQSMMKSFGKDLGVNTEGRKFIFYYAKLPQLQLKKSNWIKTKDTASDTNTEVRNEEEYEKNEPVDNCDNDTNTPFSTHLLQTVKNEDDTPGILKRVGSYENLRTPEKRLVFADDTVGGYESDTTYSSTSESELSGSFREDTSVPVHIDEVFSSHVVNHMARKTIKRRLSKVAPPTEAEAEAELSGSESENEFLQSLSVETHNRGNSPEPSQSETVLHSEAQDVPKSQTDISIDALKEQPVQTNEVKINEDAIENTDTNIVNIEQDRNDKISENDNKDRSQSVPELPEVSKGKDGQETTAIKSKEGFAERKGSDISESAIIDVTFLGKLVRTQIVVYVGSLVFRGEDSMVLMVIDKPIQDLLQDAAAPSALLEFAKGQYGAKMTLMDLEPTIVISVIDAVRYRSVTKDLVQSAVLSLTRTIHEKLLAATINTTLVFFKALFSDTHLHNVLSEEEFLQEFRTCFKNATERMEKFHDIEELRKNIASLKMND